MLISVASGKGGTGKTTVATNLAYALGSKANLLDCDVDEPNAHLFLKPAITHIEKKWAVVPEVDKVACTLCRKCVRICRFRAITVIGKSVLVFPELCHSCGGCFHVCPEKALSEGKRELGDVSEGFSGPVACAEGRLRVGEAMTPPLIRMVRTRVKPGMVNIIDAPPGTSCPVISAMKGTDYVVLVTEPTPFGLHDLTLAVEAVKTLAIPHGIVINRAGSGDNRVQEYALKENIPVLMEIPFDKDMARIYSAGRLIVDVMPEWKDRFYNLYLNIKDRVRLN